MFFYTILLLWKQSSFPKVRFRSSLAATKSQESNIPDIVRRQINTVIIKLTRYLMHRKWPTHKLFTHLQLVPYLTFIQARTHTRFLDGWLGYLTFSGCTPWVALPVFLEFGLSESPRSGTCWRPAWSGTGCCTLDFCRCWAETACIRLPLNISPLNTAVCTTHACLYWLMIAFIWHFRCMWF